MRDRLPQGASLRNLFDTLPLIPSLRLLKLVELRAGIQELVRQGGAFRRDLVALPVRERGGPVRVQLLGPGLDAGNVFDTYEDFDAGELRTSTGVGFQWLTPILGLLEFAVAYPLNDEPGDDTEVFSFTFGATF